MRPFNLHLWSFFHLKTQKPEKLQLQTLILLHSLVKSVEIKPTFIQDEEKSWIQSSLIKVKQLMNPCLSLKVSSASKCKDILKVSGSKLFSPCKPSVLRSITQDRNRSVTYTHQRKKLNMFWMVSPDQVQTTKLPSVCSVELTVRRAESSGGWDHGQGGAAVHGPQVVLHVGVHVWVRRAEGGVAGRHGSRRQANQGDVGDDGAAGQSCGAGREKQECVRDGDTPSGSAFSSVHGAWSDPSDPSDLNLWF